MKTSLNLLGGLILIGAIGSANASDSLLFFEAQGVAGYSSEHHTVYRSQMADDAMQLNSIGFDYIKKFSGDAGDIATIAAQARLAYNPDEKKAELQLYNAYLKVKAPFADVWAGHNRAAFGLASFWDTHGDLLQPLPMYGVGFDRDWGVGLSKDFERGDYKLAVTTGSGMGIKTEGNAIISSRVSYGVLSYDNYNIGFSVMGGKTLDAMGYHVVSHHPKKIFMGGVDFSYNHDNIEHKAEMAFGRKNGAIALAGFYRIGVNFMEENRLKLEGQYVYTEAEHQNDYAIAAGATYKITADLTARVMLEHQHNMSDNRVIAQIYYYFGL